MILKSVILILCVQYAWSLEEGDPCLAQDNELGSCKLLDDCEYAVKLIHVDQGIPKVCRWNYTLNMMVVCCPLKKKDYTTGAPDFYRPYNDGWIINDHMSAGKLPVACCEKVPEAPPPAEPKECPPLDLPQGDTTDIAFQKCLEYQRYVTPCVSSDVDPNAYERSDECGVSIFVDRITEDGNLAAAKEFPHMALLGCRNEVNPSLGRVAWVAGGSLISDRYVLTAGHVLAHPDYGLLKYALLGATNKSEPKDGLLFNIIDIIPHKRWIKNVKMHDIALLHLDRRVEFSGFIRPACLPSPSIKLSKERIVAGWGITGEQAQESQVLRKAFIPELDYETECKPWYTSNHTFDKETMLCAGGVRGDPRETCQGDSGGPLMAISSNVPCTYVVRGVESHGPRCGKGVPGVYTRGEAYLDWITGIVWKRPGA